MLQSMCVLQHGSAAFMHMFVLLLLLSYLLMYVFAFDCVLFTYCAYLLKLHLCIYLLAASIAILHIACYNIRIPLKLLLYIL